MHATKKQVKKTKSALFREKIIKKYKSGQSIQRISRNLELKY